ncbi:MAG: hypothetical protein QW307_02135 [Thermoplasmata archaeon]
MQELKKEITIKNHGNYILGTLDGIDFVASGIIGETGQHYGASLKLKFIIKQTAFKKLNGVDLPYQRAVSQIIKLNTTDDELPALVSKYNNFVGKNLLISYTLRDGETVAVQSENEIIEVK